MRNIKLAVPSIPCVAGSDLSKWYPPLLGHMTKATNHEEDVCLH